MIKEKNDTSGLAEGLLFDNLVWLTTKEAAVYLRVSEGQIRNFMTSEFYYLEDSLKNLCKQHIRDRVVVAAQEKAMFAGGGGQAAAMPGQELPPGPTPQAGPMPAPEPGIPAQMPPMQNL